MTTKYVDDVTGEEYTVDCLDEFGIVTHGSQFAIIDVYTDTWLEDPQAVAEELHNAVDEWAADVEENYYGEEE